MSDITRTKVKFFVHLPEFQARRAANFFGYRTEFEKDNVVRAEFREE